jgi:hypothetical protein
MYYIATISNHDGEKQYLVNNKNEKATWSSPALAQMQIDFLKITAGLGRHGEPKHFKYVIEPVPKKEE